MVGRGNATISRYDGASVISKDGVRYFGTRRATNVTLRADDRYYTIRPGDALPRVAFKTLGDSRLWWVLADFNIILDPFIDLVPGQELRVPSLRRFWMELAR